MAFDPTNGETPLTDLPQYGGAGGSQQAMEYYAAKDFAAQFGRNPTRSELSMLAAAYQGDPNIANLTQGKGAIAQYYNSIASSPDRLEKQKQADLQAKAPQYYDKINSLFKTNLDRDATDAEKQHFGSMLATGLIDDYTINEGLRTLPEVVKKQDATFRQGLSGDLQKQDAQYYGEQVMPAIQANAARQGRSLDSSGVTNSLALAAQQQNRQREGFLSGLTAQQYAGSQGLAQNAYQNAYGSYQSQNNYSVNRTAQLSDAMQSRLTGISDYNMQKTAYDQYLQKYGKRNSGQGIGSLAGGALGAGLGAFFGGPTGGMFGYQAGSGLGGGLGSLGGGY